MIRRHRPRAKTSTVNKENPKMIRLGRAALFAVLCLLPAGALASPATAAVTPAPAWDVQLIAEPTNFKVGTFQETANILEFNITNIGGAAASGPIDVNLKLPPGVTADHVGGNSNWYAFCTVINAGAEVTCPLPEFTPSSSALVVPVDVDNTAPALISSEFEISGGGAPTVKRTFTNPVSDANRPSATSASAPSRPTPPVTPTRSPPTTRGSTPSW